MGDFVWRYPCYNITDSLTIARDENNKYCVIGALTGQVSVHSLPIPILGYSDYFLLDRMVVWNDKEIQIVCFASEPLLL